MSEHVLCLLGFAIESALYPDNELLKKNPDHVFNIPIKILRTSLVLLFCGSLHTILTFFFY